MKIWDYKIPKKWRPQNETEWIWFLERKINYDDWKGLDPKKVKKYFKKINIDPGKRLMIQCYFKRHGA